MSNGKRGGVSPSGRGEWRHDQGRASKHRRRRALQPVPRPFATGEAIATLLYPYAEVVLHDLRSGRIARIWNSFTDRQAGDPSNLKGAGDLFPDH